MLTGPNLPHNWVSDLPPDTEVPLRCRIVQFTEGFIGDAMRLLPELGCCREMLEASRRGLLFPLETSGRVAPMMGEMVKAQGVRRLELFIGLLGALAAAKPRMLASASYLPDPSGFMSAGINEALAWINRNLTEPFGEGDLAAIAGHSPGAFSRSFRRHTGMSLVQYVNRLRINLACQLLMSDEAAADHRDLLRRRASTTCRTSTASSWRRRACRPRASGRCCARTERPAKAA